MHPTFDPEMPGAPHFYGVGIAPYHIYILYDENDRGVRYVGVTSNPEARAENHFIKGSGNKYLITWKRKGGRPVFRLVDSAGDRDWERAERAWIAYYRRLGFVYNMHRGGELEPNFRGVRDPLKLYLSQHKSNHQLRDRKGKLPLSPEQRKAKRARREARNLRRRLRREAERQSKMHGTPSPKTTLQ